MEEVLIRYVHFLAILILTAALVGQHLVIAKEVASSAFKKLAVLNTLYIVAAILSLAAGLLLWLVVGKPTEFYSANFLFHIKLTLFLVIVLLSIRPSIYFYRTKKTLTESTVLPRYIIISLRVQLTLLIILPLLASLVARGVGLSAD